MKRARHLLAALTLGLLCAAAPRLLQAQNLAVKITKTDNTETTVTAQSSLQAAVGGIPLGEVQRLEISAGTFNTADWNWLKSNRNNLNSLTHFTITDGVAGVDDIPGTMEGNPYFGSQMQALSMAKVLQIGENAFYGSTYLTTASFPQATTIGEWAFGYCGSLTTANFPQATTIGAYAFNGCSSLASASFPQATIISNNAFRYCSSLTTANFLQVTTIDNWAFGGCSSLTTANFPQATTIGNVAFDGCSSLTTVSFPKATTIGEWAFYGCSSLTTASFPQATTIGNSSFYGCSSLTTVSFPKATTIGNAAFDYCTRLTNLMLGSTPPSVGNDAFNNTPATRYLVPVNSSGQPLEGAERTSAINAYKAADDGNTGDNLWYGWILDSYAIICAESASGVAQTTPAGRATASTLITVSGNPHPGYGNIGSITVHKTGDTGTTVEVTNGQFTMPAYDVTVTAEFEINSYTLTYTAGEGGTIEGAATQTVTHGASGTAVTALANAGYHFTQWSDGNTSNPRTDVNVTGNITVTAEFEANSYAVSVATVANGTLATTPANSAAFNTEVTITATPAAGYHLKAGSLRAYKTGEEATAVEIADNKFTMPAYDVTVTCQFEDATGVEAVEAQRLSLYPNPARNGFRVEGVQGEQLLRVFNLAGVQVLQQRISANAMVDISGLPGGSYVVRMGSKVAKLVKL